MDARSRRLAAIVFFVAVLTNFVYLAWQRGDLVSDDSPTYIAPARHLAAGHGFTESAPVSREELREYHNALKAVIDEATRLHNAGVPADQAIKMANWGPYTTWTLAQSQAPIAIRKVYEELDGKLR